MLAVWLLWMLGDFWAKFLISSESLGLLLSGLEYGSRFQSNVMEKDINPSYKS